MTELKIYKTPAAFKVALEDRLRKRAARSLGHAASPPS
jgi:hypothetical protein